MMSNLVVSRRVRAATVVRNDDSLKRLNLQGQKEYNTYSRSNYRLSDKLVAECHGQTRGDRKPLRVASGADGRRMYHWWVHLSVT